MFHWKMHTVSNSHLLGTPFDITSESGEEKAASTEQLLGFEGPASPYNRTSVKWGYSKKEFTL
jgi:hypothetical protein